MKRMKRNRRKKDELVVIDLDRMKPGARDSIDHREGDMVREFPLEFTGVRVFVRHIGPGRAQDWATDAQSLRLQEMVRKRELKKEFTEIDWPELYGEGICTSEGVRMMTEFAERVLRECFSLAEGVDAGDDEETLEELIRWGAAPWLLEACQEAQALTPQQFPTPADPRHAGSAAGQDPASGDSGS